MGAALAGPVLTALAGSAASALVGGLFSKKDSAPAAPAPKVESPVPMPDPMAQKAQARRKAAMFDSTRMGSADTVLTGGTEKLG